MLIQPKIIEAEVCARVPDQLRKDAELPRSQWARQQHADRRIPAFLEGPSFDRKVVAVRSPAGIYTTNIAYGGDDGRDLYITESYSATILRARVEIPGAPMFSHDPQ